jgi:hypothetical protein
LCSDVTTVAKNCGVTSLTIGSKYPQSPLQGCWCDDNDICYG